MILHRKNSGSDAFKNNCIPYAVKEGSIVFAFSSVTVLLVPLPQYLSFAQLNFRFAIYKRTVDSQFSIARNNLQRKFIKLRELRKFTICEYSMYMYTLTNFNGSNT